MMPVHHPLFEGLEPGARREALGLFETLDLARFVELLDEIVDSSARPEDVESTVRCVEVYADGAVETLFAVTEGRARPVSQVRALEPDDLAVRPVEEPSAEILGLGQRQAALLAALLVLAFGLVAWSTGWVDRVRAAAVEEIVVEPGEFEGLLEAELLGSWGSYKVVLKRGPDFPTTPEELTRLEEAAPSLTRAAAVRAAGEGGEVFLALVTAEDELLDEVEADLGPLLGEGPVSLEATLDGHPGAVELVLGVHTRREPGKR